MAYETSNPIKKIAEAGGNSVFFYTDGDAIATIAASGYFNSATEPANKEANSYSKANLK